MIRILLRLSVRLNCILARWRFRAKDYYGDYVVDYFDETIQYTWMQDQDDDI